LKEGCNIKICFIAPDAYSAVANLAGVHIGGAETQQFQFAKGLKSLGHEVQFVVARPINTSAKQDELLPDWVSVAYSLRSHRSRRGFVKDSLLLLNTMKKLNADIYIQRCSFHDAPRVWLFSKILRSKFLFWIGIDYNVDITYIKKSLSCIRRLPYLYALKKADIVVSQTDYQASLLLKNFNISSPVIKNIVSIPTVGPRQALVGRPKAIWGGRINPRKNPDKLLQLSEQVPSWDFVVIIVKERGHEKLYQDFVITANQKSNIQVIYSLSHENYLNFHKNVDLVVNTASTEGYPNTLLEAFARNVPALTLGIDPDQSISKNKIGWVCENVSSAAKKLNYLAENTKEVISAGNEARSYVENYHSCKRAISSLDVVLRNSLKSK